MCSPKVRFIGDQNPFRESSAGVQFFGVSTLNPELYTIQKGVCDRETTRMAMPKAGGRERDAVCACSVWPFRPRSSLPPFRQVPSLVSVVHAVALCGVSSKASAVSSRLLVCRGFRPKHTHTKSACEVVGLVDELVVDNDPEYQWMDNFRQARTSNESRQSLLYKLDATVRRQLGKKVSDQAAFEEGVGRRKVLSEGERHSQDGRGSGTRGSGGGGWQGVVKDFVGIDASSAAGWCIAVDTVVALFLVAHVRYLRLFSLQNLTMCLNSFSRADSSVHSPPPPPRKL